MVTATVAATHTADLYLMSPPGPNWALRGRANFRSATAEPVDAQRARLEWLALAEAIEARGGTVVVLPPVEGLTGLPYAAECGHVVLAPATSGAAPRPRFLLPRMAAPHRRAERDHWAPLAARLGFEVIDAIADGEGTWEAQGDVAQFRDVTLLFFGGRSDRAGLDRVLPYFPGETLVIEIRDPAFHGNMAALPLDAVDRLVVCPDVMVGDGLARLESRFGRESLLTVSEEEIRQYATNGLPVGRAWLAPSVVPSRVRALVAGTGVELVELPMSELCEKAGGASRCLVCHVPSVPDSIVVPEAHRLGPFAARIRAESSRGAAQHG